MAVLRNITPSSALSSFQNVTVPGPSVFDVLSDAAQTAFEIMDPIALEQAQREGVQQGTDALGEYQPASVQPGFSPTGAAGGRSTPNPDENDPRRSIMGTGAGVQGRRTMGDGIRDAAGALDMPPEMLAQIISYETGGTFDPMQPGPTTQHGQHRGLIQFGEPQAEQYGVNWSDPEGSQLGSDGAIVRYFRENGWQPGMGLLDAYSIVNAGAPGRYSASDANNGGAPGDVRYKVENDLPAHLANAARVLGGEIDPAGAARAPASVQVRTQSGNLEVRDATIFTSRYDRVRQTAAAGAYSAGVLINAETDIAAIRRSFEYDPDGFAGAARGYVDQIVESAPESLRPELRRDMELEARRVLNGVLEDRHTQTMTRASNQSRALSERYSQQYAELFASGDTDGAAQARSQLAATLRYQENLPGSNWTPAQSENALRAAQQDGLRLRDSQATERDTEVGRSLRSILDVVEAGGNHEDEGFLSTPEAQNHEDYNRTIAAVHLRDTYPQLRSMTIDQLDDAIEEVSATAVGEEWELGIRDALISTRASAVEDWDEDPIAAAQDRLQRPPPTIVTDSPEDLVRSFSERARYAQQIVDAGYTDDRRFFSAEEAQVIGLGLSDEADPEERAAFAAGLVQGFGRNAASAARELGAGESVQHWIGTAAYTGNLVVMGEALTGSAMRRSGQARPAAAEDQILETVSPDVFDALPRNAALISTLMEAAMDHAAFSSGQEPPDAAALASSVQLALGQSPDGRGGVQDVFGSPTLLPPGMSASQVQNSLLQASGPDVNLVQIGDRIAALPEIVGRGGRRDRRVVQDEAYIEENALAFFDTIEEAQAASFSMWGERGPPMVAGEVITSDILEGMRLIPVMRANGVVAGQYYLQGNRWDAEDEGGNRYIVNLPELVRAADVR
jgi:hypothetical protein